MGNNSKKTPQLYRIKRDDGYIRVKGDKLLITVKNKEDSSTFTADRMLKLKAMFGNDITAEGLTEKEVLDLNKNYNKKGGNRE